jgi:hypothetical protein
VRIVIPIALLLAINTVLFTTSARSEVILCFGKNLDGQAEFGFRVEASKDGSSVWFSNDADTLKDSPAEVLSTFNTGIDGESGLGASVIHLRQRDEKGNLMLPATIVVDWMRVRMSASYVPFLSFKNLLVVRDDFDCARLD